MFCPLQIFSARARAADPLKGLPSFLTGSLFCAWIRFSIQFSRRLGCFCRPPVSDSDFAARGSSVRARVLLFSLLAHEKKFQLVLICVLVGQFALLANLASVFCAPVRFSILEPRGCQPQSPPPIFLFSCHSSRPRASVVSCLPLREQLLISAFPPGGFLLRNFFRLSAPVWVPEIFTTAGFPLSNSVPTTAPPAQYSSPFSRSEIRQPRPSFRFPDLFCSFISI